MIPIEEAAKLLGRKLCGKVPHVVGTDARHRELFLRIYVDSDAPEVAANIRAEIGGSMFEGYDVYLYLRGTPRFAKL